MKMLLIENCGGCPFSFSKTGDSLSEWTCVKLPPGKDKVEQLSISQECPLDDAPDNV